MRRLPEKKTQLTNKKNPPQKNTNTKSVFTLLLRRVSLVADLKDVTPYASAVGTSITYRLRASSPGATFGK